MSYNLDVQQIEDAPSVDVNVYGQERQVLDVNLKPRPIITLKRVILVCSIGSTILIALGIVGGVVGGVLGLTLRGSTSPTPGK